MAGKQKEDDIDKKNTKYTWIDVGAGSATHFSVTGAPSTEQLAAETEQNGEKSKENLESNQSSI